MGCCGRGCTETGFESFKAKQHQELSGETMVGGSSFRVGLGAGAGEGVRWVWRHLRRLGLVGFV